MIIRLIAWYHNALFIFGKGKQPIFYNGTMAFFKNFNFGYFKSCRR